MSPSEWSELPWWQQRIYLEGLESEGIIKMERPQPRKELGDDIVGAKVVNISCG